MYTMRSIFFLTAVAKGTSVCDSDPSRDNFIGGKFPDGFIWSVATASYQVEGAWREDGRGNSIWDDYTHYWGENIVNQNEDRCHVDQCQTGDIACDSYHQWERDINIVHSMGMQGTYAKFLKF